MDVRGEFIKQREARPNTTFKQFFDTIDEKYHKIKN